ncbi:ROK family protein [Micromonospora zamorensis]|uniref:ROK family protein n=1 Tax=Micromonospora zamorensis TaxID=709883 RepID=UPI000B5ADEB9|nr:ROK family protein [Micromonospora zamorensis]
MTAVTAPTGCGNAGCLEAVASGVALVTALRDQGVPVSDLTGVIRLIDDGDRHATALARQAGRAIGEILAVVVATQTLLIERVATSQDVGITGAAHLVIDHVVAAN